MSIRRGYYYLAGDAFDGPYKTTKEAKDASKAEQYPSADTTIRAMVVLEKFVGGTWHTVH